MKFSNPPVLINSMDIELPAKLREYLDENRTGLPPISDPDEPLHIDSLALIRLITFLEEELGVRVEDEELVAENFATLRSLHNLLQTKREQSDPAAG
ncbi:MAG: acyl carrier protein [Verrucomicrobiota bacterium]|nr:acyl carrier protein [Verrucomicrobiota bacterium]